MGARGETFAKQFESKAQEATAMIEKLSDADWKKITSAEKWPVGVVAHHIAMAHAGIGGITKALADAAFDRSGPVFTGAPAMSAGQMAGILSSHIDEHIGSIKATLGKERRSP